MEVFFINLAYWIFTVMCERATVRIGLYNFMLALMAFVIKLNFMCSALEIFPPPIKWLGVVVAVILTLGSTMFVIQEL